MIHRTTTSGCDELNGCLPACAPLANPYVPFQQDKGELYSANKGLIHGTLFPGLDLPFMGLVNRTEKTGPLAELQALSFGINELGLYLDTHPEDDEAFALFTQYKTLYKEGCEAYSAQYGPLNRMSIGDTYNWLENPWPWDYEQGGNG